MAIEGSRKKKADTSQGTSVTILLLSSSATGNDGCLLDKRVSFSSTMEGKYYLLR